MNIPTLLALQFAQMGGTPFNPAPPSEMQEQEDSGTGIDLSNFLPIFQAITDAGNKKKAAKGEAQEAGIMDLLSANFMSTTGGANKNDPLMAFLGGLFGGKK